MPSPEDVDTAPSVREVLDPSDGSTGDAGVDAALVTLTELDGLPVREHVRVFDAMHAALQDRLADVED